jgi:hypothetical protein
MLINITQKEVALSTRFDPETFATDLNIYTADQPLQLRMTLEQKEKLISVLLGVDERKVEAIRCLLNLRIGS